MGDRSFLSISFLLLFSCTFFSVTVALHWKTRFPEFSAKWPEV